MNFPLIEVFVCYWKQIDSKVLEASLAYLSRIGFRFLADS